MALSVAPSYHGGDAGGVRTAQQAFTAPVRRPTCPATLQALKTAYKKNENKRLEVRFNYKDQKTFRHVGGYLLNFVSLIGNLVKNLPLDYDTWKQIPEMARVSILPELKGWFDLEPYLNDQTMIRVGKTDKTVRSMVKLGLLQKEAKQKMPSEDDWKKGQAAWEKQVNWWADPKRVEKAAKNAENRAKKRTTTYQGSKSFAQGRHEYFVKNGRYQDLITHWRDRHSHEGVFDNSEYEDLYRLLNAPIRIMNRVWTGGYRSLGKSLRIKKGKQEAKLAKQQSKLANERAARVELVLDKFMGHYNQQQTQAGGRSFTLPPLPTTLVPETVSTSIPDPYSDPNRYYKVMNPRSSRMPNDDEDGDDKDGNANNEDGNGSDESSSESDDK
ncbi:hypothetical protein Tco_0058913 [Tanacetum coccineum]